MNTKTTAIPLFRFRAGLLLGLCALVPLRAASPESPPPLADSSESTTLQLVVGTPASFKLMSSDNVTAVLARLVETVFQQSGFRGRITVVADGERPQRDLPTLDLYLTNWSIIPSGAVECSFMAMLQTSDDIESLGVFSGSTLPMLGLHNAFHRAEAFDQAATDALDSLYGELREKNLLPANISF